MGDDSNKKPCGKKQRTLVQGFRAAATTYISQLISYVRGFSSKKKISSEELRELINKTEGKIKKVYENILKEVKVFQENELQRCKHCSKEELAKAENTIKEYSTKIQTLLGELIKRFQALKNELHTKIMTLEETKSLVTYFGEKINLVKRLTQDVTKNIQETVKDPELKKKLQTLVEDGYKKFQYSMDAVYTAFKQASAVGDDKCVQPGSFSVKSLKSTATSYAVKIFSLVRGFVAGKGGNPEALVSEDVRKILNVIEIKVKELFDEILKKVKNIQDNELENYKKYSTEELTRVKSILQEYSVKILKLSEDTLKRLTTFKNELQTKIATHEDFQSFIAYLEAKIFETKKVTEDMIKNIQATIKEPTFGKNFGTMVETNTQKIKTVMDDLYAAVKKNVTKVGKLKLFSDRNSLFSKMPTFGRMKSSDNSSVPTLSSNDNEAGALDSKEISPASDLIREKKSFPYFRKHFNSRTLHGRANVAKATYAGVLIYYIYRKVNNTSG